MGSSLSVFFFPFFICGTDSGLPFSSFAAISSNAHHETVPGEVGKNNQKKEVGAAQE